MRRLSFRRVFFGLWLALWPFLILLLNWPVNSPRLRGVVLLTLALLVAGSLVFSWGRKAVFAGVLAVYLALGLFLLLPGRPLAPAELRRAYAEKLLSFEGVPYVWGGETPWGLDCSGLIRRAMDEVLVKEGLKTGNPWAVREGLRLWWEDTTAKEMGRGYAGRMVKVTTCQTLNGLDPAGLQPGDIAVTTSGGHVLAYAGDRLWVAADPWEHRVTRFHTPGERNAYFSCPMDIMRWKLLEN